METVNKRRKLFDESDDENDGQILLQNDLGGYVPSTQDNNPYVDPELVTDLNEKKNEEENLFKTAQDKQEEV